MHHYLYCSSVYNDVHCVCDGAVVLANHCQMQTTDSLYDKGKSGDLLQDPGTEDSAAIGNWLHRCQVATHGADGEPYVCA